jgi:hypothetical protein
MHAVHCAVSRRRSRKMKMHAGGARHTSYVLVGACYVIFHYFSVNPRFQPGTRLSLLARRSPLGLGLSASTVVAGGGGPEHNLESGQKPYRWNRQQSQMSQPFHNRTPISPPLIGQIPALVNLSPPRRAPVFAGSPPRRVRGRRRREPLRRRRAPRKAPPVSHFSQENSMKLSLP